MGKDGDRRRQTENVQEEILHDMFASITNNFLAPDTLASRMSGSFTFPTHNVHLMSEVVEESV